MDAANQCTGSPTFNLDTSAAAFSEWPVKIPGFICKSPPFGYYASARFAQCCSGKLYNNTEPTTPEDEAYPMSCGMFCQVDPKDNEDNDKYPYGFTEHFMCLNDGWQDDEESSGGVGGDVACATIDVPGKDIPTSYESTWSGYWQTRSYYRTDGISWAWVEDGQTPPTEAQSTSTSTSLAVASGLPSSQSAETMSESASSLSEPSSTPSETASSTATAETESATSLASVSQVFTTMSVLALTLAITLLAI